MPSLQKCSCFALHTGEASVIQENFLTLDFPFSDSI